MNILDFTISNISLHFLTNEYKQIEKKLLLLITEV